MPSAGLGVTRADFVINRADIARKSHHLGSVHRFEQANLLKALVTALQVPQRVSKRCALILVSNICWTSELRQFRNASCGQACT